MADYRGHLTGASVFGFLYLGLLAGVYAVDAAYEHFSLLELVVLPALLFLICLMFGIWPDVDTSSFGQKVFYLLFFVVDATLVATRHFEEAAYLGLLAILPVLSRHRGWTHSWWAMVLIPGPLLVIPLLLFPDRPLSGLPFYGAAVTGYLSHLFMDGLVFHRRRARRWR